MPVTLIPQRLYVDNGSSYRSRHLAIVCANLGIALARPYQPSGKGKIERWMRTVRSQLLSTLEPADSATLEALRLLYDEVRDSRPWDMEAHYPPLRVVLDPVRHALLAHPTLARVALSGRLIGDNRFWMEILGSSGDVYAGTLIAGLMARAAELPEAGFRTTLGELNAFLSPIGDGTGINVLGNLDEASDMHLFHGLALSERIEVADSLVLLLYEEVLRFADEETFWTSPRQARGFTAGSRRGQSPGRSIGGPNCAEGPI